MSDIDLELLKRYARDHAEDAFDEILRRHLDLVYSAAHRQVRSPQIAEEVAQSVFTDLARQAQRLAPDTILAAWLYQVTRRTAIDVVRREARRQLREQIATEMNAINSPAADWTQIEPLLDEAMAALDDTDRAAVLLRYFENKSLREVGERLGVSDDAAQKRVSRAVDRLREFFAKHGVTLGASGFVALISTNAVKAAPAGLALKISASTGFVGTSIATSATAKCSLLQMMTTTNTKLLAAAIIATLALPLALLWRQNASLRRELAALRATALEAARPPATSITSGRPEITEAERQRLQLEHLELLSLRGRVTQLATELHQLKAASTTGRPSPRQPAEPTEGDSILFSAALTNRVESGNTLAVGGWSKDGIRGYLLVTPFILQGDNRPDAEQLTVQSQVVTAPESFWTQVGWGAARSETRRSTLVGVLTPGQLETLLQALKETKVAELSNTSLAKRRDGEYVGIGFSIEDDKGTGTLMGIDVYPWIAADGQSVDLEIRPSAVSTNTPIHSSLK